MQKIHCTIESNLRTASDVFRMTLVSSEDLQHRCGQFVEVTVPGKFLRRPVSVSISEPERLTILYKTVGEGTTFLSRMKAGAELELLTGLGNGFDLKACRREALLIGGGIGAAPLHQLCRDLLGTGRRATVLLGFNTASEIILEQELEDLGAEVYISTADGSAGIHGLVTDALNQLPPSYDWCYVCGPVPMMRALHPLLPDTCEFSLEERMGCGTGLCFGCTVLTSEGPRRVCHEGPVFKKEILQW